MTYELRHCQVDIPELDDFLREYLALCEKYGMELEADSYESGGAYMTISKYTGGGPYLNMAYADQSIPCIRDAYVRAEAMWEDHCAEQRRLRNIQAEKDEQKLFAQLKKKYEPQ